MKRLPLFAVCLFTVILAVIFSADHPRLYGDIRFKDFKSDRDRFERNIERARDSLTEEEWQSIVNTGREVLCADWERTSEAEAERYIRKGFSEDDVYEIKRKALDDWEREYDREAAFERGRWYAFRESIIYEGTDLCVLKESIAAAKDSSSLEEWDSAVCAAVEAAEKNRENKYLPEIEILRLKGAHLAGDELEGFEKEIARLEEELRRCFDLEMGSILYLSRNKFVTDIFYDRNSLRTRSEAESASAITEQVIQGVMDDLKKDEEAILKRSFEARQVEGIDLSSLGNDWQEELKRLVETGMKRWARAREELYSDMVIWKGSAEESYESAEARWRKAASALEKARAEWEEKLAGEIYAGIGKWRNQEQELDENIERAQKDFQTYVDTVRSQWADQSEGLMAMAVNGSKVYGEAVSSIKWLERMCESYSNIGAFGKLGEVKQGDEDFWNILSDDVKEFIEENTSELPTLWEGYYNYQYIGSEEKKDSPGNWYLEEKYSVKVYMRFSLEFPWAVNLSPFVSELQAFEVVNRVNLESSDLEKSPYFYYKTELERWKDIKDTFGNISMDAEMAMGHNMTGDPGFLVNVNGDYALNDHANENDPYLMTEAEYAYELARRDKDFWEKRLAIAKAVYDYAYPADGKRESAEKTVERKISSESAMSETRESYNRALEESSAIVEELKKIQSGGEGSIEELAKRFETARAKLEDNEKEYLNAKTALIILENGENQDYIRKEIEGIERNIAETEKRIADRMFEYMKSLKDYESASRGYEFSENYKAADERRRSSEEALKNFIEENSAGIEEEQLEECFALKLEYEKAAAVTGAMADKNFNADDFLKLDNKLNPEYYSRYAAYSLEALKRIESAFEKIESDIEEDDSVKTYDNIKNYIETMIDGIKFIPDKGDREFIIIRTALRIFEEKFKGLTPEKWGAYRSRLDDETEIAYALEAFYREEYNELNLTELIGEADNGDYNAALKIMEYYYPGSAIAGFEEITRYDRGDAFDIRVNEELKLYITENFHYFYSTEAAGKKENYLEGMIGRIILKTGYYDATEIELNGIDGFSIRSLNPAQMGLAVDAVYEYMNDLEKAGITVPRHIEEACNTLLNTKEKLNLYLYIEDYIYGRLEGTAAEIYISAKKAVEISGGAAEFLMEAGEVLESSLMSSREKSMFIASMYKDLADEEREYIRKSSIGDVKKLEEIFPLIESIGERRKTYTLAEEYLYYIAGSTPDEFALYMGLDEERGNRFLDYVKPLYIMSHYDINYKNGDADDLDVYISGKGYSEDEADNLRIYSGIKRYRDMVESGNAPMFESLAADVKVYVLSEKYYKEKFERGELIQDIEKLCEYFENEYGEIPDDVFNGAKDYVRKLNIAEGYYGGEISEYMDSLSKEEESFLKSFIYSSGTTGMPGYEAGIYGHDLILVNDSIFNAKENSRVIDLFYKVLPEAITVTGEQHSINSRDFSRAEALHGFASGSGDWDSWRDSVLNVEGDDFRLSSAPADHETSIYDERNEDGHKSIIKYSLETRERDEKSFSRSLVIDEVNRLEVIFNNLFESAEYSPDFNGIAGVLDNIDGLGENCAADDLLSSLKPFYSIYSGYESAAEKIASELYSLEMMLGQSEQGLIEKRKIYNLLSGGSTDRNERQKNLETAREAHEKVKREYEDIQSLLNDAQKLYNEKNSEYIEKMNEASSLYMEFKNLEFEYEKAYSLWEYGNTPYLKGQGRHDSGFDHGTMPGIEGDTTENFDELNVPDAKDNYERILARYEEVLAEFNEKKEAKEKQQTLEDLQGDEEYRKLKDDFLRKSEEYIRASQVDVQLNENLAMFKKDYEDSRRAYESSKDSLLFYREASADLGSDEVSDLVKIRDKILAHIENSGDADKYYNGLGWYSCKIYLEAYKERLQKLLSDSIPDEKQMDDIYELQDRVKYNKEFADRYDNIPDGIKQDIVNIYETFKVEDGSLDKIYKNFHQVVYWDGMYEYARKRAKTWKPITKRRWKKRRDSRKKKRETCECYYRNEYSEIKNDFSDVLKTRKDYAEKSKVFMEISQVLSLADVKAYLKQPKYGLTESDLGYLYDESNMEGFEVTEESINIAVRRNEKRRTDLDGEGLYAKIIDGKIAVLDKDMNPSGATYDADNPGVRLKLEGENIEEYEEGKTYELYDRSYDISEITSLIAKVSKDQRENHFDSLMDYVKKSAVEGNNDYTVMLRDLEKSFKGLVETAVSFNRTGDNGELRQRSFDGYSAVTKEYIKGIQSMVLEEMITQNRSFHEQMWQQQREKFSERKDRWMEVTGYILNRGNRDWAVKMSEFNQHRAKWRFEIRKEIEAGEVWWLEQDKAMREDMGIWNRETSGAASKAAVENIYQGLEARVACYEKNIKSNIPSVSNFNIDTEGILKNALRNIPEMSIGVLNNSINSVNTTSGLSNLLSLNLKGNLFAYNEKEMAAYGQAYSVMQNMRLLDILNAILDGFNEQLQGANGSLYEAVETGMARSMPFAVAPFTRLGKSREWKIKVCVASNITGNKYKTRRFIDYKEYENSTVFLKPVKGIGQKIDFTKPSSYVHIDKDELDVYAGLAGEFLNRGIDEVFKEGGLFSQHQESEFDRLGERFGKYYIDWEAGEALRSAAFYSKPLFPNGPSMLNVAAIAAGFAGGPWVSFAVNMLTTGIQVADGSMDWKQAGFQVGMSVATSSLGAGAGKAGELAGKSGTFANASAKTATMQAGNTLLSGVKLEDGSLRYDRKNITSAKAWASSGVNIATGTITGGLRMSSISTAIIHGSAAGLAGGITNGDWKDNIAGSMRSSASSYLAVNMGEGNDALTNARSMFFRKMLGSKEDFSWDRVAENDAAGKLAGDYFNEVLMSDEQKSARAAEEQRRQEERSKNIQGLKLMNMAENTIGGYFSRLGDEMNAFALDVGNAAEGIKSVWWSIKSGDAWENIKTGAASVWESVKGASGWIKDRAASAWNGVTGAVSSAVLSVGTFAEKTGNWFSEGHFKTDEQVEEIRAKERIQEALRNGTALEEGSAEYRRIEAALNAKNRFGDDIDSQARIDEKLNSYKKFKVNMNGEELLVKSEQKIDIKLSNQGDVGRKACYFTSVVMLAEGIMGKEVNLLDVFNDAQQKGFINDVARVNSYEGIARTAGADVKNGTMISHDVVDVGITAKTIIEQLDKKNPVLIQLTGQHAEVIYGYEVVNNSLRFLLNDPGYQKDIYLDASNFQPYKGDKIYSTEKGGKRTPDINEYRSVYRIKYFKR